MTNRVVICVLASVTSLIDDIEPIELCLISTLFACFMNIEEVFVRLFFSF